MPQLWPRSQLRLGSDPWPGYSICLREAKKEKKQTKEKSQLSCHSPTSTLHGSPLASCQSVISLAWLSTSLTSQPHRLPFPSSSACHHPTGWAIVHTGSSFYMSFLHSNTPSQRPSGLPTESRGLGPSEPARPRITVPFHPKLENPCPSSKSQGLMSSASSPQGWGMDPLLQRQILPLQFSSACFFLFCFVLFCFCLFLPFLGPLPQHMEVPRLGVESEPQQLGIRAASVIYDTAHGNAGSLIH